MRPKLAATIDDSIIPRFPVRGDFAHLYLPSSVFIRLLSWVVKITVVVKVFVSISHVTPFLLSLTSPHSFPHPRPPSPRHSFFSTLGLRFVPSASLLPSTSKNDLVILFTCLLSICFNDRIHPRIFLLHFTIVLVLSPSLV